jgi:hypothetical protein
LVENGPGVKKHPTPTSTLLEPLARDAVSPRPRMQRVLATAKRGVGDVRGAIATLAFSDRRAVAVMPTFAMYDWLRCRVFLAELQRQVEWMSQAEEVEAEVRRLMQVAEPDPRCSDACTDWRGSGAFSRVAAF